MEEKMLKPEEAAGTLDLLKSYLLFGEGDLPAMQRHAIGRLLSEVQFTLESEPPPIELPEGVTPLRR